MDHRLQRAAALSLSAALAAQPAAAVTLAERPIAKPIEVRTIPTPPPTLTLVRTGAERAAALNTVTLPENSPSQIFPTAAADAPEAAELAAPASAPPSDPSIKELASADRNIVSSESPMEKAKTLDALYDKTKPGSGSVQSFSSPPPAIPTQVLQGGRLPRTVVPKSYEVRLKVDPEAGGFSGRVKIAVEAAKPSKQIILHSLGHAIQEISVNGKPVPVTSAVIDPASETLTITLSEELKAGPASLEIGYSGQYNKQMRGLYESKAKFEGKEEKYAFTHLEPTNARRVFPAFDEPDFKAEFSLTVEAPAQLTVLSNMPAASRKVEEGWQTVTFGKTPKMSTYLFALAAARLVPLSKTVDGTKITVWTMPQDAGQAGFALEVAENALKRLNKYFGIRYQLPKMDLVAVPDFAAGAMENWGAIFFRDSALLVDPKLSSTKARRRVAEVVTHEIVHQWFGNLVTMRWWNDLWLNEAFATWMAYKIVQDWKPQWNEWIEFEQRKREPLAIDALRSTRAISAGVSSTSEIQAQFDPLTYSKGGALLRMIEGYLTADKFRKGIRAYMRRFQYGNTQAKDLWRELEKASGQPVMQMAEDWLGKPGYPVVTVEALTKDNRKLKLSQRRFSAEGSAGAATNWTIPLVINYRLKGSDKVRTYRTILRSGDKTISLPGKGAALWVYPNDDETGFYRVKPGGRLLAAVRRAAESDLEPLERMGLLNHLWAQAKSGDLSITALLETVAAMRKDESRVVLEEVSAYLKLISENLLSSPEDKAAISRMARGLLGPHWAKAGWDAAPDEDDEPRLARTALLSALGVVAPDRELETGLKERVQAYLANPAKLDPPLVSPVLNLGARLGQARFEDYRERLAKSVTPEQRDSLLQGLTQFRDADSARLLLAMTLTDEIRGQDAWKPFGALFANTAVQAQAWTFVRANWKALREKLGPRGAERVIAATAGLQSRERLQEIRAFFNDPANTVESAKRTLDQTLEAIELGVRFKETQGPALSAWLQRRYPASK
ncbi:MAG: M1 family metallopeptidase [Elusimicrobia bacterium]|nr:M1 family metallopeptidase [Elusimicrobiota bacterium]